MTDRDQRIMTARNVWNRCDVCGRFIALEAFAGGSAIHRLLEPSSDLGVERFETLCVEHKED